MNHPKSENSEYDAILYLSFGGPEGPEEVMPFLRNVVRGRNVPDERLLGVAEHYAHFGGVSPINRQNREAIAALETELSENKIDLPVYFGNRNWDPLLTDTLARMQENGVKRVLTFVTSAFSSYSGCRQYRENIVAAQEQLGDIAPDVDKIRVFYNHPLFIEAMADRIQSALDSLGTTAADTKLIFTAHSIPNSMADGCSYEPQLREAARLITKRLNWNDWNLCYQSRSGPPTQPWLEPDICDFLTEYANGDPGRAVVLSPLGFLTDHMEVLFDLDIEAKEVCEANNLRMARAQTVGAHPSYIRMLRMLIEERLGKQEPTAIGEHPASHNVCPLDCCLAGQRPSRPTS
jgi:ferrochelatase